MEDYVKLYEIPVYWISEENLQKKVEKRETKLKQECISRGIPEIIQRKIIDHETYPMRKWEYNHVAGFVKIFSDGRDILFKICLPHDNQGNRPRYFWRARTKYFIDSIGRWDYRLNGTKKTNTEICQKIDEILTAVVKERIPESFFVDRQAFDILNSKVDYMALLHELR